MKKVTNKDDQRENSKSLSELWLKPSKYYEKVNTEKESNFASLSKNVSIDFKAKQFPFILSTNVFKKEIKSYKRFRSDQSDHLSLDYLLEVTIQK